VRNAILQILRAFFGLAVFGFAVWALFERGRPRWLGSSGNMLWGVILLLSLVAGGWSIAGFVRLASSKIWKWLWVYDAGEKTPHLKP